MVIVCEAVSAMAHCSSRSCRLFGPLGAMSTERGPKRAVPGRPQRRSAPMPNIGTRMPKAERVELALVEPDDADDGPGEGDHDLDREAAPHQVRGPAPARWWPVSR